MSLFLTFIPSYYLVIQSSKPNSFLMKNIFFPQKKRIYYLHVTVSSVHTKSAADVTLRVHHPFNCDVFRQFVKLILPCNCSKVFLDDVRCCFRYEDFTPCLVSQWLPSLSCRQSSEESERVKYEILTYSAVLRKEASCLEFIFLQREVTSINFSICIT